MTPTRQKLATILEERGLQKMADRARKGYYDDYESDLPFPIIQLVTDLMLEGQDDLAERAKAGEFDGTKEEGEAWHRRYLSGRDQ